jgi:hypothetical protein
MAYSYLACNFWRSSPADRLYEQYFLFGVCRVLQEAIIQCGAGFARDLLDELAAHVVQFSQAADRFSARQRPEGQTLAVEFGQIHGGTDGSVHAGITVGKMGLHYFA